MNTKMTVMSAAVLMTLASGAANAVYTPIVTTTGNNFTMLSASGGLQGGTNDVTFTWDGTLNTSVATAQVNATITSPTTFFGYGWVAHDVKLYGAGTYTIPTASGYTLTVGVGQVGAELLFDWGAPSTTSACGKANCNISVIEVWKMNDSWANNAGIFVSNTTTGLTKTSPFCSGNAGAANCAAPTTSMTNVVGKIWNAVSIDTNQDADNWNGTKMVGAPFPDSSANFNLMGLQSTALVSSVPVPAAAWLLGSGLLGLVGVARRRKSAV